MELEEKSEFSKRPIGLIIESIIIFFIIIILILCTSDSSMFVHPSRTYYQKKDCKRNIKELNTAVEFYIMDHPKMTQSIDQNLLLEGKYIKEILGKNYDPPCNYKSLGNLSKDGIFYCELHGDINGMKVSPDDDIKKYWEKREDFEKDLESKEKDKEIKGIICDISKILLFVFLFVIPLEHLIIRIVTRRTKVIIIVESVFCLSFIITFLCYIICK